MRLLVGLIGLLLGLGVAIMAFGRMDHLRQAVPDQLPPWSDGISAGAGLLSGSARVEPGMIPPVQVTWRDANLDGLVPTWRAQVLGEGVNLTGRVSLPERTEVLELQGGRGTVELRPLLSGLPVALPNGLLRFEALDGAWQIKDQRFDQLSGNGQILDLRFEGVDIGDGTFELRVDVAGNWHVDLQVPDNGVLALSGDVSGRTDRPQGGMNLLLTPGDQFPQSWENVLPAFADKTADGLWRIRMNFP